jgi:hypothetical protein
VVSFTPLPHLCTNLLNLFLLCMLISSLRRAYLPPVHMTDEDFPNARKFFYYAHTGLKPMAAEHSHHVTNIRPEL